jgi:hypothetical protein
MQTTCKQQADANNMHIIHLGVMVNTKCAHKQTKLTQTRCTQARCTWPKILSSRMSQHDAMWASTTSMAARIVTATWMLNPSAIDAMHHSKTYTNPQCTCNRMALSQLPAGRAASMQVRNTQHALCNQLWLHQLLSPHRRCHRRLRGRAHGTRCGGPQLPASSAASHRRCRWSPTACGCCP